VRSNFHGKAGRREGLDERLACSIVRLGLP
jgi:hypothetical protein